MSTQVMAGRAELFPRALPTRLTSRIGLLGCGNVGTELVRLIRQRPDAELSIERALVRRPRPAGHESDIPFTTSPHAVLAGAPDVVVELLGGCEPARELLLAALERGIPVVTANKSLLARHGRELRDASRRTAVPLLYEAAVIAGVPFLGTFARRPLAADASALTGIVNGTSNFILSQSARCSIDAAEALREAQARGYAERDPANDINGTDAAEKLAVLLQHFAARDVPVETLERAGIDGILLRHHTLASALGGVIKPVVHADWTNGIEAFVGPAFVPAAHPLHTVDGVENALLLETARGRLLFQGPGAGPAVTAATVLDDVEEVVRGSVAAGSPALSGAAVHAPLTGWLIALDAPRLPAHVELAEYFAAHGVYIQRATDKHTRDGRERQGLLTWPVPGRVVRDALAGVQSAAGVNWIVLRALESGR